MIFTLTDRHYNVLDAYETDDYLIGQYIGSILETLEINVLVKSLNAEHWVEGNYIMCQDKMGKKRWFTIYDCEDSHGGDVKSLFCYSGTIDVVAEDAAPISAPEAKPFKWYFDQIFYDTGIELGINEISDLTRKLEFTSENASNAEMLQYVLNGFGNAEASLDVEFDGATPTKLVLNVYKRIGNEEPQAILSDEDDSLTSLDRKGSISDLATCINPTGAEDENGNPITLVGKYYEEKDEQGNILYYSPVDSPRIFSVAARQNFYVQLPGKANGEFDGYINRRYESQAKTQDTLWRESLAQLKKIDHVAVTYEANGYIDCSIGDNVQIVSHAMKPPVMIAARTIEYKFNDDDPSRNVYKFGNYVELASNLDELSKVVADLKQKLLIVTVVASAGTVFKNGTGETDLTAITIVNGKEVDTDGLFYNYVWSKYDKNGNFVGATSGKSITVYARNIDEKETYIVTVENEGAKSIGQITVTNVNDGAQGPPGPKGDDGKTTYTWRKYADDANGTNMSDNPEGKQYLGMAFNKETPIASMNPQDYSWSAMYDTEKLEETKEIANNAVDVANKAKLDAQNAQSTADGKNTVFYQATAPSTVGRKIGDVWFNTADSHKMHRFDGSNWIPAQFGTNAIANLSITNALIADGTIQNAKIAYVDASKITTGYLNAARIAAKSIDVSKLNVSTLSAITANLGDITAGNISGVNIAGVTITGSTIISDGVWQTIQSRVQLGNGVITVGDSSANNTVSPVGFIVEQDGGRLHHEFGADGILFYGGSAGMFKGGIYVQYEPYGNGVSMILEAENYTAVTSKFWVRNNEARFQSEENFIDPEPNVKKAVKVSGGIATDTLYANAGSVSKYAIATDGKIYVGGEGIEIAWPGGTPYIDFVRRSGVDFDVRLILESDSGLAIRSSDNIVRHKFYANGTKSGGSVEIDGKNLGMSPIDSPQVLLETIEFDVPLTADGTKVLLDSRFAKAVNYRFAVFPNRGEVIEKGPDYFIIAGDGLADIRIVGERVGYAGVYFDDMTMEGVA